MVAKLPKVWREHLKDGKSFPLDGVMLKPGSAEFASLQAAVSDLERGTAKRPCLAPEALAALVGAVGSRLGNGQVAR